MISWQIDIITAALCMQWRLVESWLGSAKGRLRWISNTTFQAFETFKVLLANGAIKYFVKHFSNLSIRSTFKWRRFKNNKRRRSSTSHWQCMCKYAAWYLNLIYMSEKYRARTNIVIKDCGAMWERGNHLLNKWFGRRHSYLSN